jgi:hypothetical protein
MGGDIDDTSYDNLLSVHSRPASPVGAMVDRLERVGATLARLVITRCRLGDAHMGCIGRIESLRYAIRTAPPG